jgi:hypothetical protein
MCIGDKKTNSMEFAMKMIDLRQKSDLLKSDVF